MGRGEDVGVTHVAKSEERVFNFQQLPPRQLSFVVPGWRRVLVQPAVPTLPLPLSYSLYSSLMFHFASDSVDDLP